MPTKPIPPKHDSLRAEFDAYARSYRTLHDQSMQFVGEDLDYFARYKIADVKEACQRNPTRPIRCILDFGSGIGASLPHWRREFPRAEVIAADVSADSLSELQLNHGPCTTLLLGNNSIPLPDQSVDVAYAACVFHHIALSDRPACMQEIYRVLRPGGACFVFEHNPLNPLTQYIVQHCEFDRDAQLLSVGQTRRLLAQAGFRQERIRHRVFFPGFLSMLRPCERWLGWLPLGGQYFCEGIRPY